MRPAMHDSDVIVMNDGTRVGIRSSRSGQLPDAVLDELEGYVAESLHAYLKQSEYRWAKCLQPHNMSSLTEMLESDVERIKDENEGVVRYVHAELRPGMVWAMKIHLEEASAPCVIKLEMTQLPDNK